MNIDKLRKILPWFPIVPSSNAPADHVVQPEPDVYIFPDPEAVLRQDEVGAETAARNEGAVSIDAHFVGSLCDGAENNMRSIQRPEFAPETDHEDRLIDERHVAAKEQFRRTDDDTIRARANRRAAQQSRTVKEARPKVSIAIFFAIVVLAIAATFSLIELPILKGIQDFETRLLITVAVGGSISGLIVFTLFGLKPYEKNGPAIWVPDPASPFWQAAASAIMILSFGLIRASAATGATQLMLTIALMGIDAAALMYSKSEASRYRVLDDAWAKRNDGFLLREKNFADAEREEKDCEARRAHALQILTRREQELTARLKLTFDESMIKRARIAVYAAYMRGIAHNLGRAAAGKAAA